MKFQNRKPGIGEKLDKAGKEAIKEITKDIERAITPRKKEERLLK